MATSIGGITDEDLEDLVTLGFEDNTVSQETIMEAFTEYGHGLALLPPRPFANTRYDLSQEELEEMQLYNFDEEDLIIDEDPPEERTCSGGGEEDIAELELAVDKREDNIELGSEDNTGVRSRGEEDIAELESVFFSPLREEEFKMLREQEIQSLILSNCVLTEEDDKKSSPLQYRFLASNIHSNLVHIDLSNSYGVEDEKEILNLLKKDMPKLEYLDISYIRFRNPKYPSKQLFANVFWQHVADHAIHRWLNLQTVTAYGYPLKNASNIRKMAPKLRNINATVLSARTARNMLKMMPEQTAKNSNLCDKWSDLIKPGKTQYTNSSGAQIPVDDEFISAIVPSHLDIDVGRIEGEVAKSVKTILMNTPLDVSIVIAFPFFVAKSINSSQNTQEEIDLLLNLCQKAFKTGLVEKYAMQLELFLTELIKDDVNSGEAVAILYSEKNEDGHNIFTRLVDSSGNSNYRRLLASVEKFIDQIRISVGSSFTE